MQKAHGREPSGRISAPGTVPMAASATSAGHRQRGVWLSNSIRSGAGRCTGAVNGGSRRLSLSDEPRTFRPWRTATNCVPIDIQAVRLRRKLTRDRRLGLAFGDACQAVVRGLGEWERTRWL